MYEELRKVIDINSFHDYDIYKVPLSSVGVLDGFVKYYGGRTKNSCGVRFPTNCYELRILRHLRQPAKKGVGFPWLWPTMRALYI